MITNRNIYELFAESIAEAGVKPFLIESGQTVARYDELDSKIGRIAQRLHDLGGRPGDRLVVQIEKSVENVLLYLAALRSGLVYVPLNTAYTPSEVAYFVGDTEPFLVVCGSKHSAGLTQFAGAARLETLDQDGSGTLLEHLPAMSLPPVAVTGKDLACILYTSGTTGRSKGAMLSHGNLTSNLLTLHEAWEWKSHDVLIHALPIYHVHGLFVALHGALYAGATVLFHKKFDVAAVLADFGQATVLMGVPTFYTRLLDCPELDAETCSPIRLFVSGSAPLLEETFAAFEARTGQAILERYGMTETGMMISNPYRGERVAGTVGFPLPGVEIRIARDGLALPAGEAGIVEVRGPNVFQGYWRMPERTAEEFRADGYFITGDIGVQDADGRVSLIGRAKDLIIAGGLNIYPKEIELVIDAIDGVAESAVIGVPHPDLGEGVVAVVVKDDARLTEADVIDAVKDLARFKQPRAVIFVEQLPRNAMGKVQKAELRQRLGSLFTEA